MLGEFFTIFTSLYHSTFESREDMTQPHFNRAGLVIRWRLRGASLDLEIHTDQFRHQAWYTL